MMRARWASVLSLWWAMILAIPQGMGQNATPQQLAEMQTIRSRLLAEALDYGGEEKASISNILSKMNSDGSWTDRSADRFVLERRILAMAKGYHLDPQYTGSVLLKNKIYQALQYWFANEPKITGWKNNQVEMPRKAAYINLMIDDVLQADLQNNYPFPGLAQIESDLHALLGRAWPGQVPENRADLVLGTNLSFRLFPLQALAALRRDPQMMDNVSDLVDQTFEVGRGKGQQGFSNYHFVGFLPDGSWHQHNFDAGQNYWLGYGGHFAQWTTKYAQAAYGTQWELTTSQYRLVDKAITEHVQWLYYKRQGLYSVGGRMNMRKEDYRMSGSSMAGWMDDMVNVPAGILNDPVRTGKILNDMASTSEAGESGTRYFWNSDLLVFRRPNFYAGIKLMSERTMGPELGDGYQTKNFYMGDGSTFFMVDGKEYRKARVGWDITAVPGATTEKKTSGMPKTSSTSKGYLKSLNDYCGGVSDMQNGVAAFEYDRYHSFVSVTARKGYFLFNDALVFLGNSINQSLTSSNPVRTTINQCEWRSKITYNTGGTTKEITLGQPSTLDLSNVSNQVWFHHDGIGYLIIPNGPVNIKMWAQNRSGNWQDLDASVSSKTESVNIFHLALDHGTSPTNANYQYVVFPNVSANQMPLLASQLNIDILQNDQDAMAVYHNDFNILQAAIFSPGTGVSTNKGLTISSNQKAVFMYQEADSAYFHVSDPSQKNTTIEMTVNKGLYGPGATNSGSQTQLLFGLPQGLETGKPIERSFSLSDTKSSIIQPPSPVIKASVDTGQAPLALLLEASASKAGSYPIVSYAWDLGDGKIAAGEFVSHIYTLPGTYTVELKAFDGKGLFGTTTKTITVLGAGSTGGTCTSPSGWSNTDIGAVGFPGKACALGNNGMQITSSGADIWYGADQFHFAYKVLTGDGEIVARVKDIVGDDPWTKGGVMMRESLNPDSRNVFMLINKDARWSFQRRNITGGSTMSTKSPVGAASNPHWVKIVRVGTQFWGYQSFDGSSWQLVDTDNIPMSGPLLVGMGVTSHDNSKTASATFEQITVTSYCGHPSGWTGTDIGAVGIPGEACGLSSNSIKVTGSGNDIWFSADEFHFVHQTLSGDGEIIARVKDIEGDDPWTKAGVMMRESLNPDSRNVLMLINKDMLWSFQRRINTGGGSQSTKGPVGAASNPHWVKIVRIGTQFWGYQSTDGTNWQLVATDYLPMAGTLYVGLAVTSHDNTKTASAVFEQVAINNPNSSGNTFPVELLSFSAQPILEEQSVALSWTTASEQNNAFFTIERSQDKQIYEQIASVKSLGNSSSNQEYSLIDEQCPPGKLYYRLSQTDFDGTTQVLAIEEVIVEEKTNPEDFNIQVYPVPQTIGEDLTMVIDNGQLGTFEVQIRNTIGQILQSRAYPASVRQENQIEVQVPTAGLRPGTYFILVKTEYTIKTGRITLY